jgi:hypothetical protein
VYENRKEGRKKRRRRMNMIMKRKRMLLPLALGLTRVSSKPLDVSKGLVIFSILSLY